ncbi:GTPase [Corynebacterium resistens]|uniref:GTPase n=1 Tax=Corynebacterium resistens TaxID=258224 RepID=UPI002357C0FC|nr:GTPase [Corynebacterium resistens]
MSTDRRVFELTTLLRQTIEALGKGSPALAEEARELFEMVSRPPRVAVVGRLKSGKSTLVNALTENKIAATDALECTMTVSIYRNGAPARAEVRGHHGQVERIPLSDGPLTQLPMPLNEVDYIDQYLPNARLERLTLIDTPGTATLTVENEARTKRVLVEGRKDTTRASSWADSVVFLSDSTPREDELELLSQLGMTPLTTVGVLSRADSFGAGAFGHKDPLDHARSHASRIASELGGAVYTVLPLSGLMAESALTGRVNTAVARDLATLSELDRDQVLDVLELEDPREAGVALSAEQRDGLLDILGEYGFLAGRRIAAERGAAGLVEWMTEVSGLAQLTEILIGELSYYAVLQRAVRVLDILQDLANNHSDREHVRWVHSVITTQPAMHYVMLYRSYRDTYATNPSSSLLPFLRQAIAADTPAQVVGLSPDTPTEEVHAVLQQEIQQLHNLAMSSLSAAEDEARERLVAACQSALEALH